ncbi:tetraacyldisaccharide 4'-kinase [Pelagibacteraceae bacterium]|nr:tetraacyldisaccharide 4'-kinase [Pelagibacteraceae bacterium]
MIYKILNNFFLNIWYSNSLIYTFISFIFLPFSIIYYIAFNIKNFFQKQHHFNIPIICIGNLVVGGSGKTSVALSIIKMLPDKKIVVLLKGYKGKLKGTIKVDQDKHLSIDVGDEALLYSNKATTFVCSNRKDAIEKIIENENPDLIILDDGLQDNSIYKTKCVVTINGRRGFGNKFLLPAGPLRERIMPVLQKDYIFLIIGNDNTKLSSNFKNSFFKAEILSEIDGNDRSIIAFSGIADNDNFFKTLENYRFKLTKKFSYPDHYNYSSSEIESIINEANKNNNEIYTTSKDWVRLSDNQKKFIKQFPVDLDIKNKEIFIEKILK